MVAALRLRVPKRGRGGAKSDQAKWCDERWP